MPVKKRKTKDRNLQITDEAIEAFLTVERLKAKRLACVRGTCEAPINERCSDCAECSEADRFLDRALGVKLWEPSPTDVDEDADYEVGGQLWLDGWQRAVELRRDLLAAVKGRRSRA